MSSESAATNESKSFFFGLIFKIYIAEAREYRLDNKIAQNPALCSRCSTTHGERFRKFMKLLRQRPDMSYIHMSISNYVNETTRNQPYTGK